VHLYLKQIQFLFLDNLFSVTNKLFPHIYTYIIVFYHVSNYYKLKELSISWYEFESIVTHSCKSNYTVSLRSLLSRFRHCFMLYINGFQGIARTVFVSH